MRAVRMLPLFGVLFVDQSTFARKDSSSGQDQARHEFDATEAAERAATKHDWQSAVREYTELIELLATGKRDSKEPKCSRAIAYMKLGDLEKASSDLSFEVDPLLEEERGSTTPTICLRVRAELEEQKRNLDRSAYYYRLMFRNDCNDRVAARALARLRACPITAFRVRGIVAKDSLAVLKSIHPDIVLSDTDNNSRSKFEACERLCRAPNEEYTDSAFRPNPAGGFYVFPGVLPQKGSRCGGTSLQDTSAYLENRFGWQEAVSVCHGDPNGYCPLACLSPVTDKDAGWELRTVAADPEHADSVLVVDQRNTAAGPGAAPGHNAYKLTVRSDGFLAANAPYCARLPITDSQAGALKPSEAAATQRKTGAIRSHGVKARHSLIPGTLRRWLCRAKGSAGHQSR